MHASNGVNRQISTDLQNVQLLYGAHLILVPILNNHPIYYGRTKLSINKLDKGYKTYSSESLYRLRFVINNTQDFLFINI